MKKNQIKIVKSTPVRAIRQKCLECVGNSPKEVRKCIAKDCPLYPYRMGKNPERKGIGKIRNLKSHSSKDLRLNLLNE